MVGTLDDIREACRRLDEAAGVPCVMLGAGVDPEEFVENIRLANAAGASGFLCGRAVWKHVVEFYPDQAAMHAFISADPFTRRYELEVLRQYQGACDRLGAHSVVVGDRLASIVETDNVLAIDYEPEGRWDVPPLEQVVVAVLVGQLFGMFASYHTHFNVDNRSVDKALYSRIVPGVPIYEHRNGQV